MPFTPDPVERWFLAHGLPYFVDGVRDAVRGRLVRARMVVVLATGAAVGVTAGIGTGLWSGDPSVAVSTALTVALGVLTVYALRSLEASTIVGWALRQTWGSLGLLLPLATRALPMLLLFVTFLFINTEVWQVASALRGGVLWGTVLFFGAAATLFLVTRLDEELDRFDDEVPDETVLEGTVGTPAEALARRLVDGGADLTPYAEVTGLQKVNLVLVLVVAQAVQVVLLAVAVFAFFVVFGVVAIDDSVVRSWIGHAPTYPWGVRVVSLELTRVSVFLAAFSGLYFAVYAVTDETYRRQFFSANMRELASAVSVRIAYRAGRAGSDATP